MKFWHSGPLPWRWQIRQTTGYFLMSNFRMRGLLAALALCLPVSAMAQQVGSGAVALTGPGAGASEDFNSLASSGTSSTLPTGWYFQEMGGSSQSTYAADNGGNSGGNVYSYGTAADDRAFGILAANAMAGAGNVVAYIGAQLRNDSGATINDLLVSYTGEAWRRRTAVASPDRLRFQYSTDATSLTTGTWHDVSALDFVTPDAAPVSGSGINGNLPEHQEQLSAVLNSVAVPPNGTFWVRWSDTNISGEDDGLAIDDVVFGTPVDVAPTLLSSVPVDGATDFPADGSVLLTFSEPVDVAGKWFTIACAASGDHTPTNTDVSGGPVSFFLTPATELVVGETCELSFNTTLITDQGPSTYPLEDPGTITFSVVAPPPNVPPSVVSTVPAQGASNFPSAGDLKVTFSEPVIAATGAFSLTCAESTGIALTPASSDGGVSFTIDTGTALIAGDACEFGIHQAGIQDLAGAPLDQDYSIAFTVLDGANPGAYYENVNLATPATLRCSIYETIKGHNKYPYSGSGTNTWAILNLADEDPVDTSKILDNFRNESFTKITGGTGAYNREHTWPRSYGLGSTGTPGPATDTHMLHLTHVGYNSDRGNKPFANCEGACTRLGTVHNHGIGGDSDADSNWYQGPDGNNGSFEVWDHIKGNMARAVMYMAVRYQGESGEPRLELTDNRSLIQTGSGAGPFYMGILTDLLEWNSFDAPDERELNRNQTVFNFQNNRNPFIDHPEWARRELFETLRPSSCALNLNAPVAATDSYSVAQDAVLTITAANGVLANDSDVEFDAASGAPTGWFELTASRVSAPANGTVALAADGSFSYTPNAGFCGIDSFTYSTSDGTRRSAPASVTIAVGENCGTPEPEIAIFADGFEARD